MLAGSLSNLSYIASIHTYISLTLKKNILIKFLAYI